MEIVNIVASGNLGVELDLQNIHDDLNLENIKFEPSKFPGLQIRFKEEGPVLILFSSGSYTIVGAKSHDQIKSNYDRLTEILQELGVNHKPEAGQPTIKNLICKDILGHEIDLDALVITLGFENIEYEPEQSPFVYYWPEDADCLITIPASGQCIITGVTTLGEAEEAFKAFQNRIERLVSDSAEE